MERLLKDCLIESADQSGMYFSLICTHCGSTWGSQSRYRDKAALAAGKEAAAREAGRKNRICSFCGQMVCSNCFVDVDGIRLCLPCGNKLRSKLESV